MPSLPIACSLTASELSTAKDHYRAAASNYHATARFNDDHVVISLSGDKTTLHELLTEMIARESTCCSFLTFDVEETTTGFDVRLGILDAAELGHDLLYEAVQALFPAATVIPALSK